MNILIDTIVAIATPYGMGGIGIIRVSGTEAISIVDRIFISLDGCSLLEGKGYTVRLGIISIDGEKVDEAIVLLFKAPHSYTGEDVVEIQCHGGPVVLETILRSLVNNGARVAMPGEFTRRAVVNGRISLSEAEGVAKVISAVSKQGEQAAFALSKGLLFYKTETLKNQIITLQGAITAYIDFPEEDVEIFSDDEMKDRLLSIKGELNTLLQSYETGLVILDGIKTVIVGSPNVGKSTIMNLLAGYDKAIVTPIAGTTRDILEHQIRIDGITLILADTAGIHKTDNPIEKIGIERAYERIKESDLVVAVFDNSKNLSLDDYELMEQIQSEKVIVVVNKVDLARKLELEEIKKRFSNIIYVSANNEIYLETICEAIKNTVGTKDFSPEVPILVNERQRAAASGALEAIKTSINALATGLTMDVVYISLDSALESLMELSGENVSDAVLDEVFSKFCVGK